MNFDHPYVATDMVLFKLDSREKEHGIKMHSLQVLLVDKSISDDVLPALPGGFIGMEESLEENVMHKLKEKTGLSGNFYREQLYTKSDVNRDSRGRVISCSYLGIGREDNLEGTLVPEAAWHPLELALGLTLAFDHKEIILYALERMRGKVLYTDLAFAFLPESFTLYDLQNVYELLLGKPISNFRRKVAPWLVETDQMETGLAKRPARLYRRNDKPIQW